MKMQYTLYNYSSAQLSYFEINGTETTLHHNIVYLSIFSPDPSQQLHESYQCPLLESKHHGGIVYLRPSNCGRSEGAFGISALSVRFLWSRTNATELVTVRPGIRCYINLYC
jgi:hypothetical protein